MYGLVNASGGIGYHLAALQYAADLWDPFRKDLAREIGKRVAHPEQVDLVLVGASGGYCLDPSFFSRFRSITAIDIDPLAGFLLRRRLGAGRVRFVRQDFFKALGRFDWSLARWLVSVGVPGGGLVLFSNLLGQLGFIYSESRRAEIHKGLVKALGGGTSWLSYHDRFSVKLGVSPRVSLDFQARPESLELATRWGVSGEVIEHETGEWTSEARGGFTYIPWRLDSRRTQLIEICGSIRG